MYGSKPSEALETCAYDKCYLVFLIATPYKAQYLRMP